MRRPGSRRDGDAGGTRLSRDRIVVAATAILDEEGLERLSTRRLAAALGVSPMALYRHVDTKDDIVEDVVDQLLQRLGVPQAPRWDDWLEETALGLHAMFAEHPGALQLFLRRPVTGPAAQERVAAGLERLRAAGFDEQGAARAFAAVHSYVVGYCALEAARATAPAPDPSEPELAATIRGFVSDDQFRAGLTALIRGLAGLR